VTPAQYAGKYHVHLHSGICDF